MVFAICQHESATGIHVSPLAPPSPRRLSGLSQSTSFGCPVSGIEFALAIYFTYGYIYAPDSSTLAWKTPWMEGPGSLQSMGSRRVRHNWATSLSLFTFVHCRRKWQPTPVFLPRESCGRRSLVGCRLWGRTESDTTEVT